VDSVTVDATQKTDEKTIKMVLHLTQSPKSVVGRSRVAWLMIFFVIIGVDYHDGTVTAVQSSRIRSIRPRARERTKGRLEKFKVPVRGRDAPSFFKHLNA